ncbi:putative transcriptional regulator [Desulfosporosinus acidiphilus SJ4]|uniref:Putative transcriptional regulator n=1 Tax=Desulfosporosinus acidiphilus (strain DSM 22704 / JCM 16185 / SJ4) TaxID=646529 RepID=I4D261_DESAJ|nr:helix-turn-helix domain-containing protein [Desulfosporosinus acidiphilus]AFM39885.1 putative transcriptional regulator [Desulfosporosinus acidiphilus SJ4]
MKENEKLVGRCPYVTAQKVLSGKWSLLILHYISEKTLRFNELQRLMPDLTQATLTRQLRALEENGLILRKVYHQVPPKVEYSLSDIGIEFNEVLEKLEVWGKKYIQSHFQAHLEPDI